MPEKTCNSKDSNGVANATGVQWSVIPNGRKTNDQNEHSGIKEGKININDGQICYTCQAYDSTQNAGKFVTTGVKRRKTLGHHLK